MKTLLSIIGEYNNFSKKASLDEYYFNRERVSLASNQNMTPMANMGVDMIVSDAEILDFYSLATSKLLTALEVI